MKSIFLFPVLINLTKFLISNKILLGIIINTNYTNILIFYLNCILLINNYLYISIISIFMERNTSQKQIIKEYLSSVKTHPSTEEIYLAVQKKLPSISKATVYRILKSFKEKGEIREIISDVSHFDGDFSPHAHFICNKCQKVFDVFDSYQNFKYPKNVKAGKIENYQIYFYGICKKCQKIN